jgi:hypothetical protein
MWFRITRVWVHSLATLFCREETLCRLEFAPGIHARDGRADLRRLFDECPCTLQLWRVQSYHWVWGFKRVSRQRAILTTGMSRIARTPNHLNDIKTVTLTRIWRGL